MSKADGPELLSATNAGHALVHYVDAAAIHPTPYGGTRKAAIKAEVDRRVSLVEVEASSLAIAALDEAEQTIARLEAEKAAAGAASWREATRQAQDAEGRLAAILALVDDVRHVEDCDLGLFGCERCLDYHVVDCVMEGPAKRQAHDTAGDASAFHAACRALYLAARDVPAAVADHDRRLLDAERARLRAGLVEPLAIWLMKSGWVKDYDRATAEAEGFLSDDDQPDPLAPTGRRASDG